MKQEMKEGRKDIRRKEKVMGKRSKGQKEETYMA